MRAATAVKRQVFIMENFRFLRDGGLITAKGNLTRARDRGHVAGLRHLKNRAKKKGLIQQSKNPKPD